MVLPKITIPEDLEEEKVVVQKPIKKLSDDQKAVFSYFVPVKGMEHQLCRALSGIVNHLKQNESAATGNLIIQGCQGCGTTARAISIIKVLQRECGKLIGKVGKIEADALNKKDIQQLLRNFYYHNIVVKFVDQFQP